MEVRVKCCLEGVCRLFQSASRLTHSFTVSGQVFWVSPVLLGFHWRQDLYPRYSWRHLPSLAFILFLGVVEEPAGQNRTSPHWVTEGWLWEGQRARPPPYPVRSHYRSCLLPPQRIIEPLFLSHCTSVCDLIILHVFYMSSQFSTTPPLKDCTSKQWF